MKRMIFFLLWFACGSYSWAEVKPLHVWNAGDLLQGNSGISVFRYSALGLGVYPVSNASPGSSVGLYLDGIPVRSFSPFGPDLENVSASIIDSIFVDTGGDIHILSPDPIGGEPVTTIDFGQGVRRRVHFDTSFRRSLGDSSGVLFNGSSSGIHTGEETLKTLLRSYYFNYARLLRKGGRASITAWGLRDRDALVDIDARKMMGERKTDIMTVSAAVTGYTLGEKTTVDGRVYYRSLNSRFTQYGDRKSLDDNGFGFSSALTTTRGNTSYGLKVSDDASLFDSRIHDDSWSRHESRALGFFSWYDDRSTLTIEGGILNNTEYGAGTKVTAGASTVLKENVRLTARGTAETQYPDIGHEYYSSLAFGDTAVVADLDRSFLTTGELGLGIDRDAYEISVTGFVSYGRHPVFLPASALQKKNSVGASSISLSFMSERQTMYGFRADTGAKIESWSAFELKAGGCYRAGSNRDADIWPYPDWDMRAGIEMTDAYYHERIDVTAFVQTDILHWQKAPMTPQGTYGLVDCGLGIGIGTLELFYRIENITGENVPWFDTFGWLGRNGLWGASWRFLD